MGKNKVGTPDARLLALVVLAKVYRDGAYANLALNMELNKYESDGIVRRFATELTYGTVKAGRALDLVLEKFSVHPLKKLPPVILAILRLAVYQIVYLDRIPDSAVCNEAAKQARKFGHAGTVRLVNGLLRNIVRWKETGGLEKDAGLCKYIFLQHPEWLIKRWGQQIGEQQTEILCAANNRQAPLCLRVNTLKTTRADLMAILEREKAQTHASPWADEGLVAQSLPPLDSLSSFKQGLYQVQDESSMLAAHFLSPRPGDFVLDMCAAPGGKTTHIAQLMDNKGKIVACDIHVHKLKLIEENTKRLGVLNVETRFQDATVLKSDWQDIADKILVDAPCSGLGVLRRRPDLRWRRTEKDLAAFPPLQLSILRNAAKYVKIGGKILYSTCTTEEAENIMVVQEFLSAHTGFSLQKILHPVSGQAVDTLQLWPHTDGTDGFFLAALKRVA